MSERILCNPKPATGSKKPAIIPLSNFVQMTIIPSECIIFIVLVLTFCEHKKH